MDRLPTLIVRSAGAFAALCGLVLGGCEEGSAVAPGSGRVVAVTQDRGAGPDLAAFCDVRPGAGDARPFALPPTDRSPPAGQGRWRWVNVWATWCQPCIEEMPILVEWQRRFAAEGREVDMIFLSVDEDPEVVARFRGSHPGTPETLRLTDPAALEGWITGLGLDRGATLPINVFADPQGHLRCARSGAVGASDQAAVSVLLAQP